MIHGHSALSGNVLSGDVWRIPSEQKSFCLGSISVLFILTLLSLDSTARFRRSDPEFPFVPVLVSVTSSAESWILPTEIRVRVMSPISKPLPLAMLPSAWGLGPVKMGLPLVSKNTKRRQRAQNTCEIFKWWNLSQYVVYQLNKQIRAWIKPLVFFLCLHLLLLKGKKTHPHPQSHQTTVLWTIA